MSVANSQAPARGKGRLLTFVSSPVIYGAYIPAIQIANALVGIMLPMLMAPRVFGEYALVVTLFQYGLIFDLGASQLVDRLIPAALGRRQFEDAERVAQRSLWIRLYIGIVMFALSAAALTALARLHKLPFSLGAGLLSALAGLFYMTALGPGCIYRARSARRNYALSVGTLSFGLVAARLAGILADGIVGCFAALSLWYFAFSCVYYKRMPAHLRNRPSASETISFVGQGVPFFATVFVWSFYLTANRWFASRVMDAQAFGDFAFGANMFSLLVGAVGGLSAFYYPHIVGRIAREKPFALSRTVLWDYCRLNLAIGAIIAVGIGLSAPLLALVYPQYLHSAPTVRILLIAVPPAAVASWLMPLSLSAGRRPWVDGLIIYPGATAILYFAIRLLGRKAGLDGVAWASTVSALPLVAMQLVQLRHARIIRSSAMAALLGTTVLITLALCALNWMVGQ